MRHPAKPWTAADDAELRRLLDARRQPAEVAHALGRTIDAIRGRAQVLQISLPSRTRPWKESPNRGPRR